MHEGRNSLERSTIFSTWALRLAAALRKYAAIYVWLESKQLR
jgi:hypothetical protein